MGFDMADVKPSLMNLIVVTFMAMIGIHFVKFFSARWNIPGLQQLAGSI